MPSVFHMATVALGRAPPPAQAVVRSPPLARTVSHMMMWPSEPQEMILSASLEKTACRTSPSWQYTLFLTWGAGFGVQGWGFVSLCSTVVRLDRAGAWPVVAVHAVLDLSESREGAG